MSKMALIGVGLLFVGFVGAFFPPLQYISNPPYDFGIYIQMTLLSFRFWFFAVVAIIGAFLARSND